MSDQSGQRQTVIDEGTGFKGDFNSDCPIVVKGRIEGQMNAPSLTVESTGSVSGVVKVKELRSEGVIAGEYDADYVKLSGTVKDNTVIRARTLEVALTPQKGRMQVTFGQCDLEVGDVPAKAEAIARAETTFEPGTNPAIAQAAPAAAPAPGPAEAAPPAAAAPSEENESDDERRRNKGGRDGRRQHNSSPPGR
jgi:hypothetical protein